MKQSVTLVEMLKKKQMNFSFETQTTTGGSTVGNKHPPELQDELFGGQKMAKTGDKRGDYCYILRSNTGH